MIDLKRHVVDVLDFPRAGILFRDITPLLRKHFDATLDAIEGLFSEQEWQAIDALAGPRRWSRRPTRWNMAAQCWKCRPVPAGWH